MKTSKLLFIIIILIILAAITAIFKVAAAQEQNKLPVYFFYGDGCPHCRDEEIFWGKIKNNYPNIEWINYEIWNNRENYELLLKTTEETIGRATGNVPITIIGEQAIIGFRDEQTTGVQIRQLLDIYAATGKVEKDSQSANQDETVKFPLWGKLKLKELSLPILTMALGAIDGFNPCSMWAPLVLITLLINAGNKKKIWLVGWTYIVASALSYFMFLTAWFNTFLIVGYLKIIRVGIGILAVTVGAYFLRDYIKKRKQDDLTCEITSTKTKTKIIQKLEKVLKNEKPLGIIIGIALIAFSINLIELLCSAGIPAVYTQVLAQNNLPKITYYLYLLLYDFFYMLDDIVVLLIAGFTWKVFAGNQKYAKYSHLIGGVLLTVLGIIMILKPNLLMFE